MNKNTTTAIIGILVAILLVGGIYLATKNKEGMPASDTTIVMDQPGQKVSAPIASTKSASFIFSSTAVLNGEVNPNGAQTSYSYEYGQTQSLGSRTSAQLIGSGYVKYSAPRGISGLKPNTTYYFRIVAVNQAGSVSGSILSFTTTTTPPEPNNPPTAQTKSATDINTTSADLNGLVNPNGNRTDYWFEFGATTSLGNTTSAASAGAGSSNVSVSRALSGLQPNTTYYFRLNTQNGYGTANGNILSFSTKPVSPPPAPKGEMPEAETGSATNVAKTSATLNGSVDPNGAQTTYYFEYGRSTLLGIFSLDQKTDAKSAGAGKSLVSVSANIAGLSNDTTYYYRLVAENANGVSRGSINNFTTFE